MFCFYKNDGASYMNATCIILGWFFLTQWKRTHIFSLNHFTFLTCLIAIWIWRISIDPYSTKINKLRIVILTEAWHTGVTNETLYSHQQRYHTVKVSKLCIHALIISMLESCVHIFGASTGSISDCTLSSLFGEKEASFLFATSARMPNAHNLQLAKYVCHLNDHILAKSFS